MVGNGEDAHLFPVAIHAGSPAARVDFRADCDSLAYRVTEVPDLVRGGVCAFMRAFGITLGHFDFCVDQTGRHWFLECNGSGGQFQFAEHATGLPITDAIADLLSNTVTSPPTIETGDWRHRAAELAGKLAAEGALPDPAWRGAFEQVPRHVFVPRFWALNEYNSPDRLVDGSNPADRDEWLGTVYSDRMLVTRWALRDGYRMVSSSASLPTLVAHMLHVLHVRDGHRVLEIGTGTGYNTALLCHRVGDAHVVSIDIDPELVTDATDRLAQLGYRPRLVTGDGAAGVREGNLPYDRIQSTCASPGVPTAWIEQLADDGVIVAPFTTGGALAVLIKTSPTEVTGWLDTEQAWFMPLRPNSADPIPDGHLVDLPDPTPTGAQHRATVGMDPAVFDDPDFQLWLTLHLPSTARVIDHVENTDEGIRRTGILVHTDTHRAEARFQTGTEPIHVVQDSRRLFDTIESAWHAWEYHGRPGRQRIGITARTDGTQRLWLDTPESATTWPLPGAS